MAAVAERDPTTIPVLVSWPETRDALPVGDSVQFLVDAEALAGSYGINPELQPQHAVCTNFQSNEGRRLRLCAR